MTKIPTDVLAALTFPRILLAGRVQQHQQVGSTALTLIPQPPPSSLVRLKSPEWEDTILSWEK